jgi:16S rRNA (uracil1498-N3)-methyltransferase
VTPPLFWVPAGADLAAGRVVELDAAGAHHAVSAKRLRPGEELYLADAAGRLALATVTLASAQAGGPRLAAEVLWVRDEPTPIPALVLVQALAKGRREEGAVAAATQLGVDQLIPWQADRSVPRAGAGLVDRWQRLVLAEAQVARRPRVPEVLPPVDTPALLTQLAELDKPVLGIVLHEQATEPLAEALAGAEQTEAVYLAVGPEGSLTDRELDGLTALGWRPARMGREVLRTGVAPIAALSVVSHLLGRWA